MLLPLLLPLIGLDIIGPLFVICDCCWAEDTTHCTGEFVPIALRGLWGVRIPDCVRPVTTARNPCRTYSGLILLLSAKIWKKKIYNDIPNLQ